MGSENGRLDVTSEQWFRGSWLLSVPMLSRLSLLTAVYVLVYYWI